MKLECVNVIGGAVVNSLDFQTKWAKVRIFPTLFPFSFHFLAFHAIIEAPFPRIFHIQRSKEESISIN